MLLSLGVVVINLNTRVYFLHFQVNGIDSLLKEVLVVLVSYGNRFENTEFLNQVSLA